MAFVLATLASGVASAQGAVPDPSDRVATQFFPTSVAPQKACDSAKLRIWQETVDEKCGATLLEGRLRIRSEDSDRLTIAQLQLQHGRVTHWQENSRAISVVASGDSGQCRVSGRATVHCESGSHKDLPPLEATLDKHTLRNGEALGVRIHATGTPSNASSNPPYYLHAFSILPDAPENEQVTQVFPNTFDPQNRLPGGTEVNLASRFKLIATTDKQISDEALLLVKSRDKPTPPPKTMNLQALNRWILSIPFEYRQELLLTYQIGK